MGSDPRLGIPYPEASAANDVPKDIKAVVDKIGPLMAVDLQGTLANRPAAGLRGRFYTVAGDSSSANNGRWFRDNGTAWVEMPQLGTLQTWTPTVTSPVGSSLVPNVFAATTAEYSLDGRYCDAEWSAQIWFTGTAYYEYQVSLPVPPVQEAFGAGRTQNDGAVAWITLATGNVSVRHARVLGGTGDLIIPTTSPGTVEGFTVRYRYR